MDVDEIREWVTLLPHEERCGSLIIGMNHCDCAKKMDFGRPRQT